MSTFYQITRTNWETAWQDSWFRQKFKIAISSVVFILTLLPFFFDWIQDRPGALLNDWLLNIVTATNVSFAIFSLLWGSGLWLLYRAIKKPQLMLSFLASYAVLGLFRIVTITIFPLETPPGLIVLQDPISNLFYGENFITKDLFFSGHTSGTILIGLCLTQKTEKLVVFFAAFLVGSFVLIQHIHYTIDVLAAPPLTYLCYWVGQRWIGNH